MGFLEKVSSKDRNIYWCYKRGDPVNERIEKLLEAYHGFLVPIDDFDDTMQAFGKEFNFYFSEKTIRDVINKRAEKLIDKFKEMERNRLKALSKKEAEESLSSTESMTFDYLESSRKKRVDSLESSIEENPKKADYYYDLGKEYFCDSQYSKAIEYSTKAIELDPYNAEYYNCRSINYNCKNEFEKAIEDNTKAIELDPNNAEYYNWRGINYNRLNEFEKAIEDNTKAIELEPNNAGYYNWRGISYNGLNEFEKAVTDHTKAIELNPNEAEYYYSRSIDYDWLIEYEKAVADLTKAIELNPDNVRNYTLLARILCRRGKIDSAFDYLNKAFSLKKDLPYCYNARGYIKFKVAKRAGLACETDVLNDFNKAIETAKDNYPNPMFYTDRGVYYLYSGDLDNACNDLQEALTINILYGSAYYYLAKCNEAKGDKQGYEYYIAKSKECRYIPDDDD
jgi:Flp pilus assembly protein TadD